MEEEKQLTYKTKQKSTLKQQLQAERRSKGNKVKISRQTGKVKGVVCHWLKEIRLEYSQNVLYLIVYQ